MATTTKKGSKKKEASPRRAVVKKSSAKQAQTNAELRQQLAESLQREKATAKELQDHDRQLAEAVEDQEATSEILSVIARSPMDLQSVLDAVAESAARLCDSLDAQIYRLEDEIVRKVAHHGVIPTPLELGETRPISRGSASGRAILDRQTIHIHDMLSESERDYPDVWHAVQRDGIRTVLCVPLLQEGVPIGAIGIRRVEVRPFSDREVALLKTFADEAVIAIENVRLFQELQDRNRDLTEALEQQTVTSQILGVIASSPTDTQPVLDVVAESAARLCEASDAQILRIDGDILQLAASYGPLPTSQTRPINRQLASGRAVIDRQTIHVHDITVAEDEFPYTRTRGIPRGIRTFLVTPLLCKGDPIGAIVIRRTEVRPFAEKQIALLKTFADQAVIAIENVRLFQEIQERNAELREALEHQTATAEVLGIISRSPTDVQPVLDAIVESAARVCGIDDVMLRLREANAMVMQAHFGRMRISRLEIGIDAPEYGWMLEHGALHIPDVRAQKDYPLLGTFDNFRTFLAAPLRQQGRLVGTLSARRMEVRPFTPAQIKLLETFADQAVIAIENVRLFQELTEALEQQTATSEILGVIASSPTDIQPVVDVVAESAARLCDANDSLIRLIDGNSLRLVASWGYVLLPEEYIPIDRDRPTGRAVIDRQTVHVNDLAAESDAVFGGSRTTQQRTGTRTMLVMPLLREGVAIGTIAIRRPEVRPFTDKQIALLKTFADQAVIAIENVRLFKEIQERNAELREALEHQTATSEVLGIISRSPTDVQPVLDEIVASAARVCGVDDVVLRLHEGNVMIPRAHYGPITVPRFEIRTDEPEFRWMREHGALHIPDVRAEKDFPAIGTAGNFSTFLAAPLRQQGELVGALTARRIEVRPFTPAQIKLLETFADQAVIAIENVRLFNELKESLEQQTATSEILGVIASSPTDIQPVLDAVAESAARLCEANDCMIRLVEGNRHRLAASCGLISLPDEYIPIERNRPTGRAVIERQTIHLNDLAVEVETEFGGTKSSQQRTGTRTLLVTPLLREGVGIGALAIRRKEVRPFSDKQIKLLETFAAQAVIAIENVRLFQELKESLEQQTATSEILSVIASSPTDIQPVLNVVAENAARVCGADDAIIRLVDGNGLRVAAHHGSITPHAPDITRIDRGTVHGRAVFEQQTVHVHDMAIEAEKEFPQSTAGLSGIRTALATPLMREGNPIGVIHIRRTEVRPFSEKQIALLKTFAAQAVIAIENVRLFKELQERNSELREALEHQTATSEVLGIISRSPTDVQPVLDAIVESAARVCGIDDVVLRLREGDVMIPRAHFGSVPMGRVEISIDEPQYQWMREHGTLHIPDVLAQNDFPMLGAVSGTRTLLRVPLRHKGELIGTLGTRRTEVRPFTPAQVKLLETFADQAVIAIENVRLFRELTESLEQQTATSEILGVIASSPTEIQPVMDTIAENAAKVCGANDAVIRLIKENVLRTAAHYGPVPNVAAERPLDRQSPGGRAVLDRAIIHIPDMGAVVQSQFPGVYDTYLRTASGTTLDLPLMREAVAIGVIHIRRLEVCPFTEKQIKLLETFASQAVIAIENVRLFKELQERNAELREALEHQTATAEVLGIISRSPTDVQPVLDSIVESAAKVCGIDDVVLRLRNGEVNVARAHFGSIPVPIDREEISIDRPHIRWIREHGTLHIPDVVEKNDFQILGISGARTFLIVPLLQQDELIGALTARRMEVRPFTPAQIKLLETFADQAVIAIENVRLFQELKEALEQQTATSEILGRDRQFADGDPTRAGHDC